jgi:hypothetical protein
VIVNNTTIIQNTGNNTVKKNIGGPATITTGNAKAKITTTTTANSNTANVGGCCGGNVSGNTINNSTGPKAPVNTISSPKKPKK